MKAFCIPRQLGELLKDAVRNGDINLGQMLEMSSEERRQIFERYVEPGMAREINVSLEKAMVSEQQNALTQWVKKTFTPKEVKSPVYQKTLAKIQGLDKMLTSDTQKIFLEDLVSERMGLNLTEEQTRTIVEHANKMAEYKALPLDETGQYDMKYWKEKKFIEDYVAGIRPANLAVSAIQSTGRAVMLSRPSSVVKNIIFNTVSGVFTQSERLATEAIDSLIKGRGKARIPTLMGKNMDLAWKYAKNQTKLFIETRNSTVRATNLTDTDLQFLGEKRLHMEGAGKTRKVLRAYNDIVLGFAQGVPDVTMASLSFGHTADVLSTKFAKEQGFKGKELKTKAREFMKDAMSLEPTTNEGVMIREMARQDALWTTNQHDTLIGKVALDARNVINNIAPKLRPGDLFVPFVKTPANQISAQIDRMGWSAAKGFKDFVTGETKKGRTEWKNAVHKMVRSGLGIAAAYWLTSLIKPGQWQGDYSADFKKRAIQEGKNVPPNSAVLSLPGGKEVSVDLKLLGPIGATVTGILLKRDTKTDTAGSFLQYLNGVTSTLQSIPGLQEYSDWYAGLDTRNLRAGHEYEDVAVRGAKSIADFVINRVVPGIVTDLGKITDKYERKAEPGNLQQSIMARFPYLREMVPARTTFTGQKIETESAITTLLLGSSVKTPTQDAVVAEFSRLDQYGMMPTIPNLDKPTGRLVEVQVQIGESAYQKLKADYRKQFGEKIGKMITTENYLSKPEDTKKAMIDRANDSILMHTLNKYNYRPAKKEHTYSDTIN